MNNFFLMIVNRSIHAGWMILAVILLRFVLRKAPKWVNGWLWSVVGLRLLCPAFLQSAWSVLPSHPVVPPDIMLASQPIIQSEIPAVDAVVNAALEQSFTPAVGASANPLQIWIPILAYVWAAGVVLMLVYAAVSVWMLHHKVCTAVLWKDDIFQSEFVQSPFVLGVVNPKIYLPFGMDSQTMDYVVAHEHAHIARRDHWWKLLAFVVLSIYWFHPLVWLAYILLCRDIELACDEKVIYGWDTEQRANYSQALLSCSIHQRRIAACPLAFGEIGVKARVKAVLHYRKPAFWIVLVSVIACGVVALCFLTDPVQALEQEEVVHRQVQMTREDVVRLSQKGDALTWSDFEGYAFTDIGSGMYVRQYPIDTLFEVQVGGSSLDEKPMYIYLLSHDGTDQYVDIRYYDAAEYIEAHQDNPVVDLALEKAISDAILEHTRGYDTDMEGKLHAESHIIVANESKSRTGEHGLIREARVYLVFYEGKYNEADLKQTGGSSGAIILDFTMNRFGRYSLLSYWQPRDGSFLGSDIREKFPPAEAEKILTGTYQERLRAQCEQKVREMQYQ